VNYDGVLCDPHIVELFEQLPDLAVMLDHSIRIDTQSCLSLGCRLESCPDMDAGRIHPCEERLLVLVRAGDEILSCLEKFFVCGFHPFLVQGTRIFAVLLAPFAKTRVFAGSLGARRRASEYPARTELQLELGV